MTKGVKFRSIFYRYVLFIIVLFFLGFNQIVGRGFQTITFYDYAFSFDQTQLVHFLLLLLFTWYRHTFSFSLEILYYTGWYLP